MGGSGGHYAEFPSDGSYTWIGAGDSHASGLEEQGLVVCWGSDESGRSVPPDESSTYIGIECGADFTCASSSTDGSTECWGGSIQYGQRSPPSVRFVALELGTWHGCAVDVRCAVECWGNDYEGMSTPP